MVWWGYKHKNGSIQVKRWFNMQDIREAWNSPFVEDVTGTFEAINRDEALKKAKEMLG